MSNNSDNNNNNNNGDQTIRVLNELRRLTVNDILGKSKDYEGTTMIDRLVLMSNEDENSESMKRLISEAISIIQQKLGNNKASTLMSNTCSQMHITHQYMKCLLECSSCPRKRGGARTRRQKRARGSRRR